MAHRTIALALTIALAASPAFAAGQSGKASENGEKKYCLQVEPVTGSRIIRQECKTKEQWAREGVEVGKASKK